MGAQTYIEINGKKYDAVTGKMLHGSADALRPAAQKQPSISSGTVDGFRRPRPNRQRAAAAHAAKQPQRSKTLMRQSVKKPQALAPKTATHSLAKPSLQPPASRVARAAQTQKSAHIHRYGAPQQRNSVIKKTAQLAVTPHPHLASAPQSNPHQPSPQTDPFDRALAAAQSHNESPHRKPTKRRLSHRFGISARAAAMSSAVVAGVLLAGFFAVQNVPNLSMRVAAARAGFDAQMPAYQPAGFSFRGPIEYTPGKITVTYATNADSRTYSVIQTNSNWNSDALLDNFVDSDDKQYQTYLDRGRTLFIYNGSNATWVDDGIWYQIEGDSDLTADQLIRIAASI